MLDNSSTNIRIIEGCSNPCEATITAHYPWAMGMFLGDAHPFGLERLDKTCAPVGLRHYPFCHLITKWFYRDFIRYHRYKLFKLIDLVLS